ncbi:MAG: hypothetical protein JW953_22535 [Anaerolineae bacterium]|nr:hypothetical protein [Anaerolineae bacterium]
MWSFIEQISLIRYLCLWRVNRSLARLPRCLPAELSLVLGSIIADRLPTREAGPWRKALAAWSGYQGEGLNVSIEPPTDRPVEKSITLPEVAWPIETVLLVYPGKMSYGQDELILWELKLLGNRADHSFFLEVILPAMEEASRTNNPRWHHQRSPWGRFDIDSIYAARGLQWEPVVKGGRLDLRYRATPNQWAEGLTFETPAEPRFQQLTWLTPFDLTPAADALPPSPAPDGKIPHSERPTVARMMEALITRLAVVLPGKHNTPGDVWPHFTPAEKTTLQEMIQQQRGRSPRVREIRPAPAYEPGRWIGRQNIDKFPPASIPYLELASILHLGRQTHFGCGTFMID